MTPGLDIPVLLFDGDCAFCNGCVRWMLRHERRARYCFAPLQSSAAAPLLTAHGIAHGDMSSMVVIDSGRLYRRSAAVLHLLREVRWPWRLATALVLLPRWLRDAVYSHAGARRYSWWGRADSCVIADPAWRTRVLVPPGDHADPSPRGAGSPEPDGILLDSLAAPSDGRSNP